MQLDFDLRGTPKAQPSVPVSAPVEPEVLTVAALTKKVRLLLEKGVGDLWVEGEISNFRRQSSGHCYFTLKDASAQLACVLFAGQAALLRGIRLADGQKIQAFGQITVYEQRGQYQMIVRRVQEQGIGALQAKFEALKQQLAAEGLFDAERKRPVPPFPRRIGVVTSPTGAAIRDFLHVLHRRMPGIEVVIFPARVQGKGAAAEIVEGIEELAGGGVAGPVDVIVVTRGGGSLEDLWEFNEEAVARAIVASPVPVVSAVGHEIDFTISDFAADFRAPTPSAAAEILSADGQELSAGLRQVSVRFERVVAARLSALRETVAGFRRTALYREVPRLVAEFRQQVDRGEYELARTVRDRMERTRGSLAASAAALARLGPERRMTETLGALRLALGRMESGCRTALASNRARADRYAAVLSALDPRSALSRGFTLTTSPDGTLLREAATLGAGDVLVTHFSDGKVRSVVEPGRTTGGTSAD
jgi:exodeoxyribonuclease VII large subunit